MGIPSTYPVPVLFRFLARKMLWKWEGIESEGEEARGRREGGRGEEKEGQEGSREERVSEGEEEGGERWEKEETGVGEVRWGGVGGWGDLSSQEVSGLGKRLDRML